MLFLAARLLLPVGGVKAGGWRVSGGNTMIGGICYDRGILYNDRGNA